MPKLRATTFKSSIRQSRGFRRILATSFAAFDTLEWYHRRYHVGCGGTRFEIGRMNRVA